MYKIYVLSVFCPLSQKSTYITTIHQYNLPITLMLNQFPLWYSQRPFFTVDTESTTLKKLRLSSDIKQEKKPTMSIDWNMVLYCGLANCESNYYNRKVIVYNVYLVDNPFSYVELSIIVFFVRYTCWGSIFLFSFYMLR